MALLQIAEPGQSTNPHEHKLAVGIDLGTTNSLVAAVRSGKPGVLPDEEGRFSLPSVVRYLPKAVMIGDDAKNSAADDPENTIVSVKRFLGRGLSDINALYGDLPYQFVEKEHTVNIQTAQGEKNPIEVSAEILYNLRQRAESSLGGDLQGAVITVPAYFDDAQRHGTKDAAELAGIKVLRLINEPTAAAIAYGLDSGQEGIIAVYDLGGGTFDISILRLNKGVFEVLSTGGDSALGGDDFDRTIVSKLIELHALPKSGLTAKSLRKLYDLGRKVKEQLTLDDSVEYQLSIQEGEVSGTFTKQLFEDGIAELVKKTLKSCRRALKDAEIEAEDILEVVMVGGSTRVPLVREKVEGFFKRTPLTTIDPDQVVAIGASIQADLLVGNKPDSNMLLLDVTPLSLGLETMGGLVEKVIPRNTTIPVARAQEFTTYKDGQTMMAIHVLQGERELVDDCRSLARFVLKGIPPLTAGIAVIRVTFNIDADGLLSVTAMEKSTGVEASIQVKPSYGLEEDEIANMLTSSMRNAKEDMQARMLREQQVDAKRMIESLELAISQSGHLIADDTERAAIDKAIQLLQESCQGEDGSIIKDKIKQLDDISQPFAARRMEDSIKQALTGQAVEDV
ncbi:Fe-S protein assembly chaperone HscA [Psychrosphaera sp. B3R10]|uniref:Fe-S protein assembly chaperone HscA n=1 Tax=unclassified Psychrosphaera TaxID=2641570 RepID=UPI001C08119B|nr:MULTISPECIES: Fe-S protein assembly chaperone HscA [unclassified Psychrosphaera]MBU2883623.1 Fe-S protein assembly chaperone HscA [Psychrosphaera sp. I2R16]MBU2989801.1 Fe-S protein assembly chaperone HscA [Psychrosphaera sp. B3R10]MDO6719754.1 Fe-S protein assembly chaperone HscA [Psychrosphaera sp. 1_MG-2023]